jgi:hypothetical protein
MKTKSKHVKAARRYQTLMKEEHKRARYEHNLAVADWMETTDNIMLSCMTAKVKPTMADNYVNI